MGHRKKGLLAAALCALLVLGMAIPAFGSASTVYLMAVNEQVLDTTVENMPAVVGGVLYVPYIMLSNRVNGVNLGVSALYSNTRRTVLVSNGQIGLLFDTQTNTAQDLEGEPVSARSMVRNSMVFLPIDYLCEFFGTISCSRVRTQYGTVIRVTNSSAVLSDRGFADAASNQLADNLRRYQASIAPPAASGAPPTAAPSQPPADPSPEPSAAPIQAELCLALDWGEQGEEAALILEGRGERALFLFTCQELRAQDDAVRRLAAAGHTVGLVLTGEDVEDCLAQWEEGRRLLAAIARCPALVAGAPELDGEGLDALAQAGCAVWPPTMRGADYRSGAALVEALSPREMNLVELGCGPGGAAFLRGMLSAMDGQECRLYQATAPMLSALG